MYSLTDLKNYFQNQNIPIKKFNGYSLSIGNDNWTMSCGIYYCNNIQSNPKDSNLIKIYQELEHDVPTSHGMFKAIGGSNFLKEE